MLAWIIFGEGKGSSTFAGFYPVFGTVYYFHCKFAQSYILQFANIFSYLGMVLITYFTPSFDHLCWW